MSYAHAHELLGQDFHGEVRLDMVHRFWEGMMARNSDRDVKRPSVEAEKGEKKR